MTAAAAPLLPLFMKMQDRPCLLVGAGRIALEKMTVLLECGAAIRVIAPEVLPAVERLAAEGKLSLHKRPYTPQDLDGVGVVIAATNDAALNHSIFDDAVARGQLVNVVDDPAYCDFYFGSVVRRGALQVAISTTGESPAFAQQLKQEIDEALPPDTASWLEHLGEVRRQINRAVEPGPARTAVLRKLAQREICDPVTCPCRELL